MPAINLVTIIRAPIQRVFDLSRSIDLHQQSMLHTKEKAIAGRTTGLIDKGETVTWQAKHLFVLRTLAVRISEMHFPDYFKDEMIEGDFAAMQHEHHFKAIEGGTEMKDHFDFKSPYGFIGVTFNAIFLTRYMQQLLTKRNAIIKEYSETEKWKTVLL